jgi:hypothetical protein
MTQEQKTATEAAKTLSETRERKEQMARDQLVQPQNKEPIDRPLTPAAE